MLDTAQSHIFLTYPETGLMFQRRGAYTQAMVRIDAKVEVSDF
jgi:hypothetical protein